MRLFLTFEGPDGSGKSTQARMLALLLRTKGHRVLETREPGGTPVGEAIRHILLDAKDVPMTPRTMALLLSASRSQLVDEVMQPALRAGDIVIADRYTDSTIAYQSYGLGLDLATVELLADVATDGLVPDVSIYVDVPVDVGLQRISSRADRNRLDDSDVPFHERVREGYLATIARNPQRWIVVDGQNAPDEVHSFIARRLAPVLQEVTEST